MHHQVLIKHLQEVRSIENYPKSSALSTTGMRPSARQAGRLRQQLLPSLACSVDGGLWLPAPMSPAPCSWVLPAYPHPCVIQPHSPTLE